MSCPDCESDKTKKFGKDRKGNQRFRCLACEKTFQTERDRPLGEMILAVDKAEVVLKHLVEGCSVRSVERLTGVNRTTILRLLETVGEKCEKLTEDLIQNIAVKDVQCDEIWGFVGMKEKTKHRNGDQDETTGDSWCFIAIEQNTKLILAWHLGRRTQQDTEAFTEKVEYATRGNFQINTDGFVGYKDAIVWSLGTRVDFAQIIKIYGKPEGEEHRYSPPQVTDIRKVAVHGKPNLEKAGTSHIERQNLTVRMQMRRMTRLTNAFSKKWLNLKYSYALHFFHYIRCTPLSRQKNGKFKVDRCDPFKPVADRRLPAFCT